MGAKSSAVDYSRVSNEPSKIRLVGGRASAQAVKAEMLDLAGDLDDRAMELDPTPTQRVNNSSTYSTNPQGQTYASAATVVDGRVVIYFSSGLKVEHSLSYQEPTQVRFGERLSIPLDVVRPADTSGQDSFPYIMEQAREVFGDRVGKIGSAYELLQFLNEQGLPGNNFLNGVCHHSDRPLMRGGTVECMDYRTMDGLQISGIRRVVEDHRGLTRPVRPDHHYEHIATRMTDM